MTEHTHTAQWAPVLKFLHWALFLVVLTAVILVLSTNLYPDKDPHIRTLMFFHKSFGVTALGLIVLWALIRPGKGRPTAIGRGWQLSLARLVHGLMVLLIFAMPIAGLLMSQFGGRAVDVFGLFTIPVVLAENKPLAGTLHTLHAHIAAPLLIVLILLHIAGALWHHLIDRDATLSRMLPGRRG